MSRVGAALRAQPLPPTSDLPSVVNRLNNLIATLRHDLGSQVLYQSVSSPAQLTGNQNNYAIGSARVVRLSSDASRTITGFRGGVPNQELTLINVGAQNIVLAHQSASSDAANRFLLEAGANLTLGAEDAVTLYYDQATARWRNYAQPVSSLSGTLAYAQLPTGNGSWDTGAGTIITITRGFTVSGLLTGSGGVTVASGQTLTLTGATVAGAPTWSSNQAITLSTAAQPNITSVGTLTSLTVSGLLTAQAGFTVSSGDTRIAGLLATQKGRFEGTTVVSGGSGNGIELSNSAGWASILGFNRTTSAYDKVAIDGSQIDLGVFNVPITITARGNFVFGTDNAYDIGASGATRPRNLYLAGTGNFANGLTVSGGKASATYFQATADSGTDTATMALNATYGLLLRAATGSLYDFGLMTPASSIIARVATGTQSVELPGGLSVTGGTISASGIAATVGALTATNAAGAAAALRYDASNRLDITISSAGAVTYDAVGASAGHNFSDSVAVTGLVSATTRITAPLIGTTSATDVVFDRNSITQLTLGSLLATFAGAVSCTALTTNDSNFLIKTIATIADGAGAVVGTLNNAPGAVGGDPQKWIPFDDNGTTRYIPTWIG